MTTKLVVHKEIGNHTATRPRRHGFVRHVLEMVVAMMLGMAVLGGLVYGLLSVVGVDDSRFSPETDLLIMVVNMTVGMAVWMRHRKHAWPGVVEMSGAMFVPFFVLVPLFWSAAISEDVMFGLGHILMLPAMLAVMLRRRHEYAHD